MSDTDVACARPREFLWDSWMKLRNDVCWGPPGLSREAVWNAVFAATEEGCLIRWFGVDWFLVDLAIRDGLPRVVQRLMDMGIKPGTKMGLDCLNAMHVAAEICPFAEMFMVLPVELLTGRSASGSTPLHLAVKSRNVQAVRWMLEQPCCPVEAKNVLGTTAFDYVDTDRRPEAVAIRAAFAARKRWTALRAVWVGAVVSCAK